ncbi:MAG: bacteriocin [Balneolaceae bacterium]|nr:MAG: bacteriocin [Balneolaceae bacterium]
MKELTKFELKNINGGDSLKTFFRWLGRIASRFVPCECEETGINYENYEDYVLPNDPLM